MCFRIGRRGETSDQGGTRLMHPSGFQLQPADESLFPLVEASDKNMTYHPTARKDGSDWNVFPGWEGSQRSASSQKSHNHKLPWTLEDKVIGNVVHNWSTDWSYLK